MKIPSQATPALLLLSATLAAGCGCPPTPQQPVRLPDAKGQADESDEAGANQDAEPRPAPKVEPATGKKPEPSP